MEQYRFFDSIDGEDERYYTADEFAEYFRQVISSGILNGGTNLKVTCTGTDMNVQIKEGYAWLEGYLYKIDTEPLTLTLDAADPALDRIDRVVIRLDKRLEHRYIKAFVLESEPAEEPMAPDITRDDNVYEIALAQVRVIAGKSFVAQSEITDERLNTEVCGLANSLVTADTTEIFNQFQDWYNSRTAQWQQDWNDWWVLHPDQYNNDWETWRANAEQRFEDWFANQQTEGFVMSNEKGQPNGIPTLDENAKVPHEQLPPMNYLPSNNTAEIKDGEIINAGDLAFIDESTGLVEGIRLAEHYRETYNKIIPEKIVETIYIVSSARTQRLKNDMYASSYAYTNDAYSYARVQVFKLDEQGNHSSLAASTYTIRTNGIPYSFRGIEITDVSYSSNGQYAYIGFFIKANQNDVYCLVHALVLRINLTTGGISQQYNKDIYASNGTGAYYRLNSGSYQHQTVALADGNFAFVYTSSDYGVTSATIQYTFVSSSVVTKTSFSIPFPSGVSEIRLDRTVRTFGPLGSDGFSFLVWGNTNSRWYLYKANNLPTHTISYEMLPETLAGYKSLGVCFYNNQYIAVYKIGTSVYRVTDSSIEVLMEAFSGDNPMCHIGYYQNGSTEMSYSQVEWGDILYFATASSLQTLNISNGEVEVLSFTGDVSSIIYNQSISLVCSLDSQSLQVISKYLEYQGGLLFTEFSRFPVNKNLIQVKETVGGNKVSYELALKDESIVRSDKVYLDLVNKALTKTGKVSSYLGQSIKDGELSKPLIKTNTLYYRDLYVQSLLTIPIPDCDKVNVRLIMPSTESALQLVDVSLVRRSLIEHIYLEGIYPSGYGEYYRPKRGAAFSTYNSGTIVLDLNDDGLEIGRAPRYNSPTGTLTIKEIVIEVINHDAYSL